MNEQVELRQEVTISTVGDSGLYPVTTEGRIAAVFLMIGGIGLLGTFTGFIASFFLGPAQKREEADIEMLTVEIRRLQEKIDSMSEEVEA